ncbi:hypothetical protein ALI144C_48720 [Actinosynnema sp. ALI-1.44]|uniref:tetratricopeptide repeat protein n=1 Tax=Actinosynnema sp. ALI-1.44 TaxID=1933779 RepID=UPI00097CA979|nr:toll/interleukin-1 receptor domain-containing protein [Actinosynnema sp. ALI-1.44]ONI70528.1 hypothetical protein ALI144C_48720 [Actinosynnema sp. ALI-1.44]
MNDPAVFLSCRWTDEGAADGIERALRDRGLAVFRDKDIHLFDGVTDSTWRALDSSAVLIAFYSRRYHAKFACQWALTRAFLAARRLGDPLDRVLIVNPEPDDRHIAPGDLADAHHFSWRRESDTEPLADAVAGKVERAQGPLCAESADRLGRLRGRLSRPRRFSGRYREMWSIHSELRSRARVVVVEAPAGTGKTALAEQYSLVFGDAYPGGVVWTSMAGVDQPVERFAAAVNTVARERFGLDLSGMGPRQARETLAERTGDAVLWVVDDVPDGLAPAALNALIVPSANVHTIVTMRAAPPWWSGGRVVLAGLSTVEEEELDGAYWPGNPGHLVDLVRARSRHARIVLGFASVLSTAPVSGALLVRGVADLLGRHAPTLVVDALAELDEHGLLSRVAGTASQSWRLNALVAAAVQQDLDPDLLRSLNRSAARTVVDELRTGQLDDCTHATVLASNMSIPSPVRRSLMRAAAAAHEERGDIPAARSACERVLGIAWAADDAEAAARLALAMGEPRNALQHTETLISRAQQERNVRSEFHARLIAATAHDVLGEYAEADEVFHHHAFIRLHGAAPVWLSEADRQRAGLARVRALRVRGEFAVDELHSVIRQAHPHDTHTGVWPVAAVELARIQVATGEVTDASATARRVLSAFTDAGIARHHVAREATAVLVEGELITALPQPDRLTRVIRRVRAELHRSTKWYGSDSPLSLELMVLHGRALIGSGEHGKALDALADAQRRAAAALGGEHPFTLRTIQWTGLATMGRGDWKTATEVFEQVLTRQIAVLGSGHPESQLTRFHLSRCLLRQHKLKRARPFLDQVTPALRDRQGALRQWARTSAVGTIPTTSSRN